VSTVDQSVSPVLLDLLDCLRTEVDRLLHPPANVSLRPGSVMELLMSQGRDECCEGVAWVRVIQVYPSSTFPIQDLVWDGPCGPAAWAVQVELGVARCAPTPDMSEIPSSDVWDALSLQVMDDAAAVRKAVCCYTASNLDRMILEGQWLPTAVEGGCVGGAQILTVAIGACDCDEPEPEPVAVDAVINAGVVAAAIAVA
jgi:hypothetical protein